MRRSPRAARFRGDFLRDFFALANLFNAKAVE